MRNSLIESIGKQLNITKTADVEWVCQAVYSTAGKIALASLWDRCEEENKVSIQHFKNRLTQIFDAYADIYPEIKYFFPENKTVLVNEIYSIYIRNGFVYHSDHNLSPARTAVASKNGICAHRCSYTDEKLFMSGLGFYSMRKDVESGTVATLFGLQEQGFERYLEETLLDGDWESVVWPDNTEFLRIDPPFTRGYWQQEPLRDGRLSLARYGDPMKMLVFYRFLNGGYQQKVIPEWRVRDYFSNDRGVSGEYRRIATALLKQYGHYPAIRTKNNCGLVEVKLGYRLPPSEEEFFKLYSWPLRYDFNDKLPQVFTRKMAAQFYPLFKGEMEAIGYSFVEE